MAVNDAKEEIRQRLNIVEVVSQYVPLRQQGRRFGARCPFHQEKTASFFVDPDKGFWKCFGCGLSGDIFSFVMQIEGLNFPEAAERLAQRAGVQWKPGPGGEKTGEERQAVLAANAAAASWFRHMLFEPQGSVALEYLRGRGLSDQVIKDFMLGYAPEGWDNLANFMAGKGYNERLLATAGLVRPRNTGGGVYDFFRHRVMFPVVDVTGRVVAFGGRALDPEEQAKYMNSPDTPVFKKGSTVYGLNMAREHIARSNQAIVVEGYMDVIALAQAGFGNVVACLGTATTEDHLKLLSRYAESIFFVYDADAAGMRAALRNITVFEGAQASARLAVLPSGQDPDDCVRSENGPHVFQRCLDEAMSFPEYEIKMAFERFDMNDADGRMRAAREAVNSLLKVHDRARREELLDRVAARWAHGDLSRSEQLGHVLRLEMRRRFSEQKGRRAGHSRYDRGHIAETLARSAGDLEPGLVRLEETLLTAALHDPERAKALLERLVAEDFADLRHRRIAEVLPQLLQLEGYVPGDLVEMLDEEDPARDRAIELAVGQSEWSEEEFADAIAKIELSKAARGLRPRYEVTPSAAPGVAMEDDGEDFAAWRRRVVAAIDSGEITPDDPDYIRFMSLGRRFQGTGQQGISEMGGLRSWGTGRRNGMTETDQSPHDASAQPDERS